MEKTISPLRPPTHGNFITVLSIDGGGIRGIIPGIILSFLESELQVTILLYTSQLVHVIYVYKVEILVFNLKFLFNRKKKPIIGGLHNCFFFFQIKYASGFRLFFTSDHFAPLVNVFTQASADIVNYHISVVFKALDGENNYLRIHVIIKLGVTFSSYILVFFFSF